MKSELDILIPVYNEEDNIKPLVKRLNDALRSAKIAFHLYLIDDHSTDRTVNIARSLQKTYPLTILTKQGQRGKAFSILEGSAVATAPYLAMIDADLQYPPEVLPEMFKLTQQYGVVVAKRQENHESWFRKMTHQGFQWFFGKVLHGLECDVQSGLKVFKKEIIDQVSVKDVTAWTLDIPLLTCALNLGFAIGEVDITFDKRRAGQSKIQLLTSIREIGGQAIAHKFKRNQPFKISPDEAKSMKGAGVIRKGKRFITHTTLEHRYSALEVFTFPQKVFIASVASVITGFLAFDALLAIKVLVGGLSFVYFSDVLFNLYVIVKSLQQPPEISIPRPEIAALKDKDLPIYTVMCPLYKEAHVLPHFLKSIAKLDWPKNKLDVILLLEADDVDTIKAAQAMDLPSYVSVRVVPDSEPKTKPKACNYGLHFARGEFLVIYDAEDSPDPLQLKKVFLAFQRVSPAVKCIQAKLNFYNPHQNLLTRFFTAEYSLWFDVVLTGLQSIQTALPLGGTSNHFRTQELRELEGWDPFNVTEDADLGVRLFKRGAITAIIDSVTLEEANSSWKNWLRQRSRWIKGYMQTYLVHMRNPLRFFREYGAHAFLFQLIVGGKISFMLINPLMWLLTVSYFGLYAWVGPAIESMYPTVVFYMAVTSLLFGNFLFVYYYMIGAAKREHWSVIKWVFLVPFYWLMVSVAAMIALYQLIVKPHYWEKTIHGLHLKKEEVKEKTEELAKGVVAEVVTIAQEAPEAASITLANATSDVTVFGHFKNSVARFSKVESKLKRLSLLKTFRAVLTPAYLSGLLFICSTLLANALNMATNFYLGKHLQFHDFGIFNLLMSLFYLTNIPVQALGSTINYQSSYLLGKHSLNSLSHFRRYINVRVMLLAVPITLVWLAITPFLPGIFNTTDVLPFVLFSAVWFANLSLSVNGSYLTARLLFIQAAILTVLQPLMRLIAGALLAQFAPTYVFVAVIIGLYIPALVASLFAQNGKDSFQQTHEFHLPRAYFVAALLTGLSTISFFSLDNLVIAHLMSPEDVGKYAFMGLFGKMVFFIGSLTATFLGPIVARREGSGQNSRQFFYLTLLSVGLFTLLGYLGFVVGPYFFGTAFFGDKIDAIKPYLLLYGVGIAAFTLAQVITSYHLLKKQYFFPVVALLLAAVQILGLFFFHHDLTQVTWVMTITGILHLLIFTLLHIFYPRLRVPLTNVQDFLGLFQKVIKKETTATKPGNLRILIFNWRDINHVWAGGAETYIHNVAKGLVAKGHSVTLFCGNDGRSSRSETIDGVRIIRRGGFYTVYLWAMIYYVLKLRNMFDVIIDSENGIPFLTPLFVKKPIFLLIHHVHRDVFIKHLPLPLALLARSIEEILMPLLYREKPILTVSESSQEKIALLGISHPDKITIIHPGIEPPALRKHAKTLHPSVCFVGRLKAYKNVDILINAFKEVQRSYPKTSLTIAGSGESEHPLKELVNDLGLKTSVTFAGKVSDETKNRIYATHWLAVQPSMIEGWGITVIEANACGTPVIASDVSGLRDSTRHKETGLLVPARDVSALTQALIELIENKPRRTRYSKAALSWSKKFTWTASTELLESTIKNYFAKHKVVTIEAAYRLDSAKS